MVTVVLFTTTFIMHFHAIANQKDKTVEKKLIEANIRASEWIDRQATSLDLFLSGREFTKKANKTRVTISGESTWEEGGLVKASPNLDFSLRLPNLEKQYQVMFSNYNKDEKYRSAFSRRIPDRREERSYGASIGFFRRLGKVNTTFQPRVELKDPLQSNYLLRFESEADHNSNTVKIRSELFADSEKGTGEFLSVEYHRKLLGPWSVMLVAEEEYQDGENFFKTLEGFSLGQSLSERMGLAYSVSLQSTNRPSFHLNSITLSPSFTHMLYKNVLHYSFLVNHSFMKEENFKGETSASIFLDLIF